MDVKNYKWRLNPVWHSMLYSCTRMETVDVKGLTVWCPVQTRRGGEPCNTSATEERVSRPVEGSMVGWSRGVWSVRQLGTYQSYVRQRVHQLGTVESCTSPSAADRLLPGRLVTCRRRLFFPASLAILVCCCLFARCMQHLTPPRPPHGRCNNHLNPLTPTDAI